MFSSTYLNTIFSFFTIFAETTNVSPCVASPGTSGSSNVNHALILMIAIKFKLSLEEAEKAIRASLSGQSLMIMPRPVGWWQSQLESSPFALLKFHYYVKSGNYESLQDFFWAMIILKNVLLSYPDFNSPEWPMWFIVRSVIQPLLITPYVVAEQNTLLLSSLVFLSAFIFLQVFFVQDVLLLFVVMDLTLSIFAVLFSLTGLFTYDFFALAFFFILLTLAACETAISLGFLVSFSRRHKSASLTLSSLRYAVI